MNQSDSVRAQFAALYGTQPEFVVRAPGRVNLIGEHTDYNDGFVFPAAIDLFVTIAGSSRPDRQVRAYSLTFDQSATFSLDTLVRSADPSWINYIQGIAAILKDDDINLAGMNIVIEGTVPIGSGLSSSAAIEIASCLAFEAAGGFDIDPLGRAKLAQRAEREFVGVNCGIMDQFISSLGKESHALLIDTRSLEYEAVRLPRSGIGLVIADTNRPRGLVDSEYNKRRSECGQAVEILSRNIPGARALRDVALKDLERFSHLLPKTVYKRARHVVTENERVLASVEAVKVGDISGLGKLMNESHDSLREDYEVSCLELDAMVYAARNAKGTFGSRMTGAGFGGCTISLVAEDSVEEFKNRVGRQYAAATGRKATFYVCQASDGARRLV